MVLPKKRSESGIPVGVLIIVIGSVGIIGLVGLGAWSLMGMVKLETMPVTGEWQAKDKPWRLDFRADKTVVSSTGPSQTAASQAWTLEPGTYRIDYFGTLWVKLKNGGIYLAVLAPPPGAMAPLNPNRFDLIQSGTEAVTVFDRTSPLNPKPLDSQKQPRSPNS
jgi:hypothetical protein